MMATKWLCGCACYKFRGTHCHGFGSESYTDVRGRGILLNIPLRFCSERSLCNVLILVAPACAGNMERRHRANMGALAISLSGTPTAKPIFEPEKARETSVCMGFQGSETRGRRAQTLARVASEASRTSLLQGGSTCVGKKGKIGVRVQGYRA